MVGLVGLGVGDRVRLAPEDTESKEYVRGFTLGGESVSEALPSPGGVRVDMVSLRDLECVKWAASLEPREGDDTLMAGGIVGKEGREGDGSVEDADDKGTSDRLSNAI